MLLSNISKDNLLCMGLGSSSWIIINATWAQLAIFSKELPEKFEFGAYCMLALIFANFIPILLSWRVWKNASSYDNLLTILLSIIIIGMICCVLLSLFWNQSVSVSFSDSQFSLPLLLLIFVSGFISSATNVTYYPYLASFPASCVVSLSFGSAMGTIFLVLLAIIQTTGAYGNPRFTVSTFYLLCLIPFSLSLVSLYSLEESRKKKLIESTQIAHDNDNTGQRTSSNKQKRGSSSVTVLACHATHSTRIIDNYNIYSSNDRTSSSSSHKRPTPFVPPSAVVQKNIVTPSRVSTGIRSKDDDDNDKNRLVSNESFAPTEEYVPDFVDYDDDDEEERYSNIDLSRSITSQDEITSFDNSQLFLSLSSQPSVNTVNSMIIRNLIDRESAAADDGLAGSNMSNNNDDNDNDDDGEMDEADIPRTNQSLSLSRQPQQQDIHTSPSSSSSSSVKRRRYTEADLSDGLCCNCCCLYSTTLHDSNEDSSLSSSVHWKYRNCCNRMCLPRNYWWIYDFFFSPISSTTSSFSSSLLSSSDGKIELLQARKLEEEERRKFFVKISCILVVNIVISAVGFGIAPAIISKSCEKVPNPHASLFWSTVASLLLDPLFRILTYRFPLKSFKLIPTVIILSSIALIIIASKRLSSSNDSRDVDLIWTSLPVALYSICMALFAYTSSSVWTFVHQTSSPSVRLSALIWVGMSTQLGALIGGVIGFSLVLSL